MDPRPAAASQTGRVTIDDDALRGLYRAVRVIRAREDGPWPGVLVQTGAGETRVLVDVDSVGPQWHGWSAAPDGHVLAPLDLSRRVDGHDIVLPVCVERLDEFVRRRAARLPLTPGEAVTLGVSVLRGCAELVATPDVPGEWWLDDAGRPVLATDASSRRAVEAAVDVLDRVSVDAAMQRTWDTAIRALTAERLSVLELTAGEDALFALAAPEPLTTVTLAPRSAGEGAAAVRETARDDQVVIAEPPRSMWHALVAGVDDDLADTVSRATTAVWRRLRPTGQDGRRGGRRAPWLVGAAVAVVVLVGGALWPTASGVATAGSPGPAASPDATPMPEAASAPEATGGAQLPVQTEDPMPDLAAVTSALLDQRLACGADQACLAAVIVTPASVVSDGVIGLPPVERSVTLLDDFGDLAVLRVDARDTSHGSQLVVIIRQDEKWLLRDVHDVAQQP